MAHLRAAVALLSRVLTDMRVSTVYRSPALLPEGAPAEWNIDYYNMAVAGKSSLSPQQLLAQVKAVEQSLGRVFRGVWGPREIDVDILAMDGLQLQSPELIIPHKGLLQRDFALLPLAEIVPEWNCPATGVNAAQLCKENHYDLEKVGSL